MKLKSIFLLTLACVAIFETFLIFSSVSLLVLIDQRNQQHSKQNDFQRVFSGIQTELVGNLMLGHSQLFLEQLNRLAHSENMELVLKLPGVSHVINSQQASDKTTSSFDIVYGDKKYGTLEMAKANSSLLEGHFGWIVFFVCLQVVLFAPIHHLDWSQRWTPVELTQIANKLTLLWLDFVVQSKQAAIGKISSQVAHDIRSPLCALELVTSSLENTPEAKRIMLRSAVQRIEDIVNNLNTAPCDSDLSNKGNTDSRRTLHLADLIESLLSEKRLEMRRKYNVSFRWESAGTYGLFVNVQPLLFKRVLSNLINNAVESYGIDQEAIVELSVDCDANEYLIRIKDFGKGIKADVLPKLMVWGSSFEKENGSGLGLVHAKEVFESWGGRIKIQSIELQGTRVSLILPAASPPSWHLPKLSIQSKTNIVILDDDLNIHNTWNQRLKTFLPDSFGVNVHSVFNPKDFEEIHQRLLRQNESALYLCDHELCGQTETGLDLIERLQIHQQSVLVTSHSDDPKILDIASQLKLFLLPKNLAINLPIEVN